MLGAIAGDIIGSVYEGHPQKSTEFPLFGPRNRFTDDTVLLVGVAYAIMEGVDYTSAIKEFGQRYPNAGYGGTFIQWLFHGNEPYNSWGNGSAMRVSPVGFAFDNEAAVLTEAERSATITHNHPEGIKGAQATALAIFLARRGHSKATIRQQISKRFEYDLARSVADIRPNYSFDVSCQGSVPEAIIAFLDSTDFEHAVRLAISLGGDSDTQACIAGGIAQAFYGKVPAPIANEVKQRLPQDLLSVVEQFNKKYL